MFACRTTATGANHKGGLSGLLLGPVLVDRAVGDGESAIGDRDARVQADLEQHLADLVLGEAVAEGGLGVHRQLILVLEGGQHGQRDDRALRTAQPGPGPDLAPGVPGDPVLERGGELGRAGRGPIHVGVAEDRPANRHALLGAFFVVHCARSAPLVASCCYLACLRLVWCCAACRYRAWWAARAAAMKASAPPR